MITLIIIIVNQVATRYPEYTKKLIKGAMYKQVQSVMSNAEFEEHFSPPYNVRKLQGPTKSYCHKEGPFLMSNTETSIITSNVCQINLSNENMKYKHWCFQTHGSYK